MLANICILIILIIIKIFGGLASLLFRREPIHHAAIQEHYFVQGYSFARIMTDLSALSDELLGSKPIFAFLKIVGILLICFAVATCWYAYQFAGSELIFDFLSRGLTVKLDRDELEYLILNWPGVIFEQGRNLNTELYVGDVFARTFILCSTVFVALAVTASFSVLNTLSLIRKLKKQSSLTRILGRMASAFGISLLCDLLFILLFLVIVIATGKIINMSFQEQFSADITNKALKYSIAVSSGRLGKGETAIAVGLILPDVNFDELSGDYQASPAWLPWILSSYSFAGEAWSLCDRYDIRATCRDRLRSLFFRRYHAMGSSSASDSLQVVQHLYGMGTSLACGHNIWSTLPMGRAVREGLALTLPLFASLAAVLISKLLVIPILIAMTFLDYAIVRVGRYAAVSSERGLSVILLHGATLLTTPPIIAIGVLAALLRWVC